VNIYLAAAWSRRGEMKDLAAVLEKIIPDLIVNCRWIKEDPTPAGNLLFLHKNMDAIRSIRAKQDREDIYASDLLVRFTDDLSSKMVSARLATGSRMAEMGMALTRGIPVIVVGGKQCIFDYLPEVQHVKNVASLKRLLRKIQKADGGDVRHTSRKRLEKLLRKMGSSKIVVN
jgi:hypothetical protein